MWAALKSTALEEDHSALPGWARTEEMAWWVRHLLCKPDNQSSNPQYPHEMHMGLRSQCVSIGKWEIETVRSWGQASLVCIQVNNPKICLTQGKKEGLIIDVVLSTSPYTFSAPPIYILQNDDYDDGCGGAAGGVRMGLKKIKKQRFFKE